MTSSPFPRVSLNGPSSATCRLATSPTGPASPDGSDPLTGATLSLCGCCPCCTRHPCSAHSLAQPSLPGRGLDVAGARSVFTAVHRTRTFSSAGENESRAEQTATGDGVRDRVRQQKTKIKQDGTKQCSWDCVFKVSCTANQLPATAGSLVPSNGNHELCLIITLTVSCFHISKGGKGGSETWSWF